MTEMQKLATLLIESKIPFQVVIQQEYHTPQIFIPNIDTPLCDIACNKYTIGNEKDLLEIFLRDDKTVKGELTAEDVMNMFEISY